MEWWQVTIMAVVEGLSEFLPISSTGHLVLVSEMISVAQTPFVKSFEIAIQVGAIAAVLPAFLKEILKDYKMAFKVAAAFVPTGIAGVFAYGFIKAMLLGNAMVTGVALAVGGVFMIWWERRPRPEGDARGLTFGRAVKIGLIQILSMVPGVSRAAATIIGGEVAGLSRPEAVKFSFFLAIPTIAAATGLDILKTRWNFSGTEWKLLGLGTGVAFVSAFLTVRWLIAYVKTNNLTRFGWYRIGLGMVWLISGLLRL